MGERIGEKGDVPDCVKSPTKTSARCEIRHGPVAADEVPKFRLYGQGISLYNQRHDEKE